MVHQLVVQFATETTARLRRCDSSEAEEIRNYRHPKVDCMPFLFYLLVCESVEGLSSSFIPTSPSAALVACSGTTFLSEFRSILGESQKGKTSQHLYSLADKIYNEDYKQ
jgi:hypothetical protein